MSLSFVNSILSLSILLLLFSCDKNQPRKWSHTDPVQEAAGYVKLGRAYTIAFYSGAFDSLRLNLSDDLKTHLSTASLSDFREKVQDELGVENHLCFEEIDTAIAEYSTYNRIVVFSKSPDTCFVQWGFDESLRICNFQIGPIRNHAPNSLYATKTALNLPFADKWTVVWGGRYVYQNAHASSPDQCFACDFVITRNRMTHDGDGTRNEQYYCFNKPVLAPGSGRVADLENNIEDNEPGTANSAEPAGNYVVIDHENNEYSLLAHFKKGSIVVRIGDSVVTGEEIGRCGNSGSSSEPHIHHHLSNAGLVLQGECLPAQFQNYIADGVLVSRGEPVVGQRICRNIK